MPAAAVAPTIPTDPLTGPAAVGAAGPAPAPEPGFAQALAAQRSDPAGLRTVSLATMVSAMADGPITAPDTSASGYSASDAFTTAGVRGPSDAWGAAADRPAGITGAGAAVIDAGERYLGVPYQWGGTSASTGFDCSGFVQQVYADLGVSLPRVSIDQSRAGTEVAGGLGAAQPGDLVFWRGTGSRPNHIGIYAGEGRMLVAPRTGDVVRYQEITRTPDAVRRIV